MTKIPDGYALHHTHKGGAYEVESADYEHMTVEDLIEILRTFPQDSKVWIHDPNTDWDSDDEWVIFPPELISGHDGNMFIG